MFISSTKVTYRYVRKDNSWTLENENEIAITSIIQSLVMFIVNVKDSQNYYVYRGGWIIKNSVIISLKT